MKLGPVLSSQFFRVDAHCFGGYVRDEKDFSRKFVVELIVDGVKIAAAIADGFSGTLDELKIGDARHGFTFSLAPAMIRSARAAEARVANLGLPIGQPLLLADWTAPRSSFDAPGEAAWAGGLKFVGWTLARGEEAPRVCAYVDDEAVAEIRANRWRHVDLPRVAARRAFELHLPDRFADGQVWRVSFRTDDGQELSGGPIAFCAFERGLEERLARIGATPEQKLQGRMFDLLLPPSLPFSVYKERKEVFRPAPPLPASVSFGVLLLDGDGFERTLDSLERQSHADWTCGALPPGGDSFSFQTRELADFIGSHAAAMDWFLFALPGVVFDETALARMADCVSRHPDAALIYSDFDIEGDDGAVWPAALPAFDYERLLEQGYFCAAFVAPRRTVEAAVRAQADTLFRVANVGFDLDAPNKVFHLPGAIFRTGHDFFTGAGPALRRATQDHLLACGMEAEVKDSSQGALLSCRVKRRPATKPRVSILIPTRNRKDLLAACLESIYDAAARARAEIIVIDNESSEAATLHYLRKIGQDGVRVLPAPGDFNFARINNLAASAASGDFLCFLNNDIVALDHEWLEEMLSRHADDHVGAVGAKLLWPSRVVQHGGVVLGINFSPLHAFRDRIDSDPGYGGLMRAAHCCSAVTAACMTTPRALFHEAGGFDEIRFPINFNDVDYCLKLGAQGRRIVFTPHARLIHMESVSRGRDEKTDAAGRFKRELQNLRNKWGEALVNDPYYNPLLALTDPPYSALAWPPRSLEPRSNVTPGARKIPDGF